MHPSFKSKKAAIVALSFSVFFPLLAQQTQDNQSIKQDVVDANVLVSDPKIITGKLENGLRYIIRQTAEPKERASMRLYVEFGSLDEKPETNGIAHFLEHLLFNGSRTHKRGELIPAFQSMGLAFGSDVNAYTSVDRTVYMLNLPNTSEKLIDFSLNVFRDFADGASLTEEAIDKERGVIVSELKVRDSESYRAMLAQLEQLTEGTRLTKFFPIGHEKMIRETPYAVFREYYENFYTPDRMTFIVTGDFDPAAMEKEVIKHLSQVSDDPKGAVRGLKGDLTNLGESELVIANPESASVYVAMNVIAPFVKKPDTLATRLEDAPIGIAQSIINRRLSRIVREPNSPLIAAFTNHSPIIETVINTSASATAKPENWQKALQIVEQENRRAIEYGFSDAEINEKLANWESSIQAQIDSWEAIDAGSLADSYISNIASGSVATDPAEDMRVFQAIKAMILADKSLPQKALKQAFDQSRVKLAMSGTLPEGIDKAALRSAYEQSRSVKLEAPEKKEAAVFAYDHVGEKGSVVTKAFLEDLGVTTLVLSNGIKVNLKPLDSVKGSINLRVAVDGGSVTMGEQKTPGIAWLAGEVMGQGGLEAHSNDELRQILAGKRVGRSFSIGYDRFNFSGSSSKDDFDLQCKLLIASILHPGYRAESLDLFQRGLPSLYNTLKTTENGAYGYQAMRALFGDDYRFIIPEQSQLEKLSIADVQSALTPHLEKGAMEVTIVGDFVVEDVIPVLESTFAAMPSRAKSFVDVSEKDRQVDFEPWNQRDFFRYETKLDKTLVSQVRPVGDGRDALRNRRLNVLTSIVREKLFDGIRQNLGEAYSPSVRLTLNTDYDNAAYITTSSAGVLANRTKVSAAMDTILAGIGQGSITEDDFNRAIRPIRNQAEKSLRSAGFWMSRLAKLQSDSEYLQLLRSYKKDIDSISYDEILNLSKEVFTSKDANFFFVVPDFFEGDTVTEEKKSTNSPSVDVSKQPYLILISHETAKKSEWKAVADTLVAKYPDSMLVELDNLQDCASIMRAQGARYAAFVAQPEEIDYVLVNKIHRAARQIDSDPWGDCMWGIITGYTAADAMRIAKDDKPLVIKRSLSTTNIDTSRFEHGCSITDWRDYQVFEQSGYTKPVETVYDAGTPEGDAKRKEGMQGKFSYELANKKPQLIVTSAHATEYNLEMPFGKGLIFSYGNHFYQLKPAEMRYYAGTVLPQALQGNLEPLKELSVKFADTQVKPDGTTRVWFAVGNCLYAHVRESRDSMAVTSLSNYTCNQVLGYTVPSWYGDGGWGALSFFFGNAEGTSLAQAWYLNNQYLLDKTMKIDPKLLNVEFNSDSISKGGHQKLVQSLISAGFEPNKLTKDHVGVVHDRDVVALLGDPMWQAVLDESHVQSSLTTEWVDEKTLKLTATRDHKARFGVWYPKRMNVTETEQPIDAIVTNDFILIPEVSLKEGESMIVKLR